MYLKNMYLFALENELPCFIMCVMVPFEIKERQKMKL